MWNWDGVLSAVPILMGVVALLGLGMTLIIGARRPADDRELRRWQAADSRQPAAERLRLVRHAILAELRWQTLAKWPLLISGATGIAGVVVEIQVRASLVVAGVWVLLLALAGVVAMDVYVSLFFWSQYVSARRRIDLDAQGHEADTADAPR